MSLAPPMGLSESLKIRISPQVAVVTRGNSGLLTQSMATTIKPLSGGQERRLREYLDDRFLAIQKGFSKRSVPQSHFKRPMS